MPDERPLRVLGIPGRLNEPSPYIAALVKAMQDRGIDYVDLRDEPKRVLTADVLHVHWPEANANTRTLPEAVVRSALFAVLLVAFRLRGAGVVWTVHNVGSHEARRGWLERIVLGATVRCATMLIVPSRTAERALVRRHTAAARTMRVQVPLPAFRRRFLQDREAARRALSIGDDAHAVIHFGQLRPYKGLDTLLRLVRRPECDGVVLLLLGTVVPASERRALVDRLAGCSEVRWLAERYTDEDLDLALSAADVAVFPFRDVMHSHTVLDALTAGIPVVASGGGALGELAQQYQTGALHLVDVVEPTDLLRTRDRWVPNECPPHLEAELVWDQTGDALRASVERRGLRAWIRRHLGSVAWP